MMRRQLRASTCAMLFLPWCLSIFVLAAEPPARPAKPKSGIEFAGAGVHAMQADDAANPGMLWVVQGEALWNASTNGVACVQCHGAAATSMKGIAASYPRIDNRTNTLINLEGRINSCRKNHQRASALAYESMELLALTTYIAHQSRGMPMKVEANAANRDRFNRGEEIYATRMGQMNLACTHCHDKNTGRTLLAETISEGHSNAYPLYRLEWQTMGSLHRRFKSCMVGLRAEPFAAGSEEFLALETFLAWRAAGLAIETPGVRR